MILNKMYITDQGGGWRCLSTDGPDLQYVSIIKKKHNTVDIYNSNLKCHYFLRTSYQQNTLSIVSSARANQATMRVNNLNSTASYEVNMLVYF